MLLLKTKHLAIIDLGHNCSRNAPAALKSQLGTTVTELGKGYVKMSYAEGNGHVERGSDAALLAAGFACVTPLVAPCEASDVDTSSLSLLPGTDFGSAGAGFPSSLLAIISSASSHDRACPESTVQPVAQGLARSPDRGPPFLGAVVGCRMSPDERF